MQCLGVFERRRHWKLGFQAIETALYQNLQDMDEFPRMVGSGSMPATQEIHIFLAPLNPGEQQLQQYFQLVDTWNASVLPTLRDKGLQCERMKACHLALVFRRPRGVEEEVCVMQSARYIRSNDPAVVVEQSHADAQWFRDHGFDVVREKIEASAYGIDGVPQSDEPAREHEGKRYFEFHMKVRRADREDGSPITAEEIDQLKTVAVEFSRAYKIPVPLSFNKRKDKENNDGKGHQRFLNLRFRGKGIDNIKPLVRAVEQRIAEQTAFTVVKTISEWVWYDTYTQMDAGWIDFTEDEFRAAFIDE